MATINGTAISDPSLATNLPCDAHRLGPFIAGEALLAGAPCYIKASDGKAYNSNGTAVNAAAKVDGWCLKQTDIGRPVTLYHNVTIAYGSPTSPAPGSRWFVSATAGSLDDAATTGGTAYVAFGVAPPAGAAPTHGFLFVKLSAY